MTLKTGNVDLAAWRGKQVTVSSDINCAVLDKLAATLETDTAGFSAGAVLPPLWHWLFFQRPAPHSQLGADGHAQRGDFLPPVTLPRRMWAGSRVEFFAPLVAGQAARQQSEISNITSKIGKSGPLVFVTVSHQVSQHGTLCLQEQQDIVFREVSTVAVRGQPPEHQAEYTRSVSADPALLFRYSALTFNAHRIHYDRDYARDVEQYPGLVVHGPLMATMLLDLWQQNNPGASLASFRFRALAPVFDLTPFQLCGRSPDSEQRCLLWVENSEGNICLQAEAVIA
ncbi:MAG: MaoC family dehydratase N-terminal domain-containing protein [Pseudohongiellaceae bacterium]|jgi:3-methylfumaryl-CoA hydratase